MLNGSGTATDGYNWDAFGNLVSRAGSNPTMFAWNEASGYQSDSDDGLTLLGHRYYDKRTGRFISQDHAKSGGNWYRYASNNPTNKTDPSGMSDGLPGSLGAPDQRYGGLGGFLDGGGMSSLDGFWDDQNASMERGHEQYLAYEVIGSAAIAGTPHFADYVRKLLDEIAASPIGLQLLDTEFYNKKVLAISYYHNPDEPNSYYDPNVDGILFDPALHFQANSTSGGLTDEPPVVILEHEMGHAVTGLLDPDDLGYTNIYTSGMTDNIAVNENPFREFLGLEDRVDHGGQGRPGPYWFTTTWFDPSW